MAGFEGNPASVPSRELRSHSLWSVEENQLARMEVHNLVAAPRFKMKTSSVVAVRWIVYS